jgi:hypothetical protein
MKFLKRNAAIFIALAVLIIPVIICGITIKQKYNYEVQNHTQYVEIYKKFHEEHPEASSIQLKDPYIMDTYSMFSYIFMSSFLRPLKYVFPILIMFAGSFFFYRKFKSGFFKHEQMREKYSKSMFKAILNSQKSAVIVPIFLIVTLLICYIVSGHFDFKKTAEYYNYPYVFTEFWGNVPLYFAVFILNLTMQGMFFINITLIYTKKCDNYFVMLTLSFLTYIMVWVLSEVLIGGLVVNMFNLPSYYTMSLALSNFWFYEDIISLPFMIIYAFTLLLISSLAVYLTYHKKEGVNIAMEK